MGRASWHRDQDSVVGQLAEWEVWVEPKGALMRILLLGR
jgi:hypothetical protein